MKPILKKILDQLGGRFIGAAIGGFIAGILLILVILIENSFNVDTLEGIIYSFSYMILFIIILGLLKIFLFNPTNKYLLNGFFSDDDE